MSGRVPKASEPDPKDVQREHDRDPFKKLREKPGIKVRRVEVRRATDGT